MKRFVGEDWKLSLVAVALSLGVVAITEASAGATYLITFGFAMIVAGFRIGPDRIQLWREQRDSSTTTRR